MTRPYKGAYILKNYYLETSLRIINIVYCLILLLFSAIGSATDTSIEKTYPLYPEIWGYDMSEFPAMKWGLAGIDAYSMDDGDIWLVVDYSYRQKKPMDFLAPTSDDQYALIKFFNGEIIILNLEERIKLFEITKGKEIDFYPNPVHMTFGDGSEINVHQYSPPKMRCHMLNFSENYIVKTDPKGNETKIGRAHV